MMQPDLHEGENSRRFHAMFESNEEAKDQLKFKSKIQCKMLKKHVKIKASNCFKFTSIKGSRIDAKLGPK